MKNKQEERPKCNREDFNKLRLTIPDNKALVYNPVFSDKTKLYTYILKKTSFISLLYYLPRKLSKLKINKETASTYGGVIYLPLPILFA